jgi:hypothetical protein
LAGGYSITASGGVFSGSNYFIKYIPGTLTVTKAPLTVTGTVARNKVYDGASAAALTSGTLVGVLTGDLSNVSLTQSGTFASKDAANGIAITATDSLSGAASGNYSLTQPTGLSANITAKPVTLTAPVLSKVYDGTVNYTATAGNLTSLSNQLGVSGDTVTAVTLAFTNKDAGSSNRQVDLTAYTLSGNGATNYTITPASNSTSTITKKPLTQSGLTVSASKQYDGDAVATVIGTAVLQAAGAPGSGTTSDGAPYTGDTVSVIGTSVGTYNSPNVANAATVAFSGLTLDGLQAGNYSLTAHSPANATITQRAISVTANNQSRNYGSANPTTGAVTVTTGSLASTDALSTATVSSTVHSVCASCSSHALRSGRGGFSICDRSQLAIVLAKLSGPTNAGTPAINACGPGPEFQFSTQ